MEVVLFGAGKFGKVHANDLAQMGALHVVVDTDRTKQDVAEKYGVPFYHEDFTDPSIEFPEEILEADAFDIVTNTPSHFALTLRGIERNKKVFVEKPPVERVADLARLLLMFQRIRIVAINYIEMAHPVVMAAKDNMQFKPEYFLNIRTKDRRGERSRGIGGGEGFGVVLEDLVHDLSEILLLRGSLRGAEVTDAEIETWRQKGYPYNTDAQAEFKLMFPEAEAEIFGSFVEPKEVRQFVVASYTEEIAIYGNTLTRQWISPVAARIKGEKNIKYIIQQVKKKILTNEQQKKVLKKTEAEILEKDMSKYVPECKWKDGEPMYGWAPLWNMLNNFLTAKSNYDLICSLQKAFAIQRIGEQVYKMADKEHATDAWML